MWKRGELGYCGDELKKVEIDEKRLFSVTSLDRIS